jgi:pyruvate/2-oxoglutarate dehydrogenase complex dihydrolipoamide acyltransferase (E2) component
VSAGNDCRVDVVMPEVGWPEVAVSAWYAEPGDRVYAGDRLVEVKARGATFDVPAPASGVLAERAVHPRDVVRPGQVLGTVAAEPE